MNKVITFVSIFTVVFFLMLTVILGLVIHYIGNPEEPLFWFLATLFIGMFISLLVSLGNIGALVKINKNKIDKMENNDHSFTTCPNYWLERIVINNDTNEKVKMCYNILPNKDITSFSDPKQFSFIDGELISDNQTPPEEDFTFTNSNFSSNLSYYRNMASYSNIETFVNLESQYSYNSEDYQKNFHYHDRVDISVGSNVSGNSNIPDHGHATFMNVGRRGHSHSINWDQLTQQNLVFTNYNPSHSNFNYWINPIAIDVGDGNTKYAIELNLNKLNLANNSCELAKLFNWGEYTRNCLAE